MKEAPIIWWAWENLDPDERSAAWDAGARIRHVVRGLGDTGYKELVYKLQRHIVLSTGRTPLDSEEQ